MDGTVCTKKRMWRWRSNPLRRRDDIIEAWIVLLVWAVVAVGGSVAGLVTAHAADEVFARQRVERHRAQAVLLADVPPATSAVGAARQQGLAEVRWTAADGTTRTDRTLVTRGLKAGAEVDVWLDRRDGLVTEPPSRTEAAVEAAVLGAAAALALAGTAFGVGAVARWQLKRRCVAQWGREWELVGPEWGRQNS
ncbi:MULTISPECIES: hypothetical protein [unclassified Streptomyces]|uniref:Rv1733c family protein n=1 Tax=unclassified Streptomyces TaxID=2593676 RepID=UPI001661AA83|nr:MULTISPECIES: hypothetical protein [unclassified Streptomyces]MBD0842026.1 hypothetical protein [Streptomyces sp. TRM68416]